MGVAKVTELKSTMKRDLSEDVLILAEAASKSGRHAVQVSGRWQEILRVCQPEDAPKRF